MQGWLLAKTYNSEMAKNISKKPLTLACCDEVVVRAFHALMVPKSGMIDTKARLHLQITRS